MFVIKKYLEVNVEIYYNTIPFYAIILKYIK